MSDYNAQNQQFVHEQTMMPIYYVNTPMQMYTTGQPKQIYPASTQLVSSPNSQSEARLSCRFWANGSCRFGDQCWYGHAVPIGSNTPPLPSAAVMMMPTPHALMTYTPEGIFISHTTDRQTATATATTMQLTPKSITYQQQIPQPSPSSSSSSPSSTVQTSPTLHSERPKGSGPKTIQCKFWAAGRCTKGPACPFAHNTNALPAAPLVQQNGHIDGNNSYNNHNSNNNGRQSKQPCRFFLAGRCNNGSLCRFSHGPVIAPLGSGTSCTTGAGKSAYIEYLYQADDSPASLPAFPLADPEDITDSSDEDEDAYEGGGGAAAARGKGYTDLEKLAEEISNLDVVELGSPTESELDELMAEELEPSDPRLWDRLIAIRKSRSGPSQQ